MSKNNKKLIVFCVSFLVFSVSYFLHHQYLLAVVPNYQQMVDNLPFADDVLSFIVLLSYTVATLFFGDIVEHIHWKEDK